MAERHISTAVAWVLIAASVAYLAAGRDWLDRAAPPAGTRADAAPSFQLRLIGRYAVGVHALSTGPGGAQPAAPATAPSTAPSTTRAAPPNASPARALLPQVDQAAGADESSRARLVAAVVAGEVGGPDSALVRIPDADSPETEALRTLYTAGPGALAPGQRELLKERLGWFGDLALARGAPAGDPRRREVTRPAVRTALTMMAATVAGFAALLAGAALVVVGIVRWSTGSLRFAYRPPEPGRPTGPFLEAFAAYLGGMALLSAAVSLVARPSAGATWFVIAVLPFAFLWPMLRGVPWAELRHGLGWTAGRGVLREAAAGVAGYLAGLPLLAAGALVTLLLQRLSGADTAHPIVEEIARGGARRTAQLVLLAAVWAPLVEETMFRGAFYHHLRRRLPWPAAAAVVGVIFAAIHPQGWAAIPALAAIAFSFATVREWRGSIIAPAVAHALNNGAVTLLLLLLLR